ncbi:DotD/TraH family lipoprotein [Alteromonas stellipolaris]|jgi:defect-in-organelle-trafficking protein DotD|uniref:Type IV secretion protein DotD n=1 Tax=Alteromonas stellipolaris TaxID=233316 RepID=A0ABN4LTV2_9ALTE|nr:DotD/TraH family lipoprotein [Alteromonas stellipolaris]AMJ76619.1 type IV secretion protein DotD [Alteromonas stellipolaris]MBZ2163182.1 DotD/TraH family lipoprotein [Alteromonas stellipolaris]
MMKQLIFVGLVGVALSGCASHVQELQPDTIDPVTQKIAILAEQMVSNSNKLAQLQKARYLEAGNAVDEANIRALPVMQQLVNLGEVYNGPLDAFINHLSKYAGMEKPRYLGLKPSANILITADARMRPLYDILEDVGQQTGTRAIVVYKASENLIETTYEGF